MYTPPNFTIALVMMVATAFCWGSWANTYKGVKNFRFELFYWDYAIGIFVISLILALTMGNTSTDASNFWTNFHAADNSNIGYAMIAGAIFNLANLLLVAGIDIAGLSIAFPVSIGIALVVGVALTYLREPKGSAVMLGAGVLCAIVAVIMDGKAYGQLRVANRGISRKSISICIVSGVLMGLWSPISTHAMRTGNSLGPYSLAVFFTLGALLSCFIWNIYFMKYPLVGEPVAFSGYFKAPASAHFLGLLGGFIWGVGTVFSLVAGNSIGFAIAYAIGQSAPMVAALWGVLVWKEFAGANKTARAYLALMFAFYAIAILLVARAHTSG
ncbi:MAG TPA: GRP family sugar transporter [Candidatus Acidoferrales bacterium]